MEEEKQLKGRMIRDSWLVRYGSSIVLLSLILAAFKQNWILVAILAGLFCAIPVVVALSVKYRIRKNKAR